MQCWRPCPLPPAQPSVALGSSASPLSMRSTITKLVELSIFSKVAGNKQFSSWCPSLLPPLHAFPPPPRFSFNSYAHLSHLGPVHVHCDKPWRHARVRVLCFLFFFLCFSKQFSLTPRVFTFSPSLTIIRCWGNSFLSTNAWSVTPTLIIIVLSNTANHNVTERAVSSLDIKSAEK